MPHPAVPAHEVATPARDDPPPAARSGGFEAWPSVGGVLSLQRTAGNRAVGALLVGRRRRALARSPAAPEFVGPTLEPPPSPAVARLAGTEMLYEQIAELERLDRARFEGPPMGPVPWEQARKEAQFKAAREVLDGELEATGFDSIEDYRATAAEFLDELREHAVALTERVLDASHEIVRAEHDRYTRPEEVHGLFNALATVRSAVAAEQTASASSMGPLDLKRESLNPPSNQRAGIATSVEQHRRGETARQALVPLHPILADPELRTETLAAATRESLGPLLRGDADARLANIDSTRADLDARADLVFKWPRMTALALEDMGLPADSVYERLVADRRGQIELSDHLVRAGWAALAVGLAALSFGGGGLALAGMVGSALLSGAQIVDEWQRYSADFAAAHTAFDTAQTVSADEPSLIWVAVALLGAGLDGAALVGAFRAAAPAARALGEAGEGLVAVEARLGLTTLSPELQQAVVRAAAAEADYRRALAELSAAWRRSLTGQSAGALAADLINQATLFAYTFLRNKAIQARTWKTFEEIVRRQKNFAGVTWTEEDIRDLRVAFGRGLANASDDEYVEITTAARGEFAGQEAALRFRRPFFALAKYSGGARRITFTADGDMLLDGVPVGASRRLEVYQKAGVAHAVRGHGADSSYELIAEESNQIEVIVKGEKKALTGKSSRFANDEVMFRAVFDARRAYARGLAVTSPENPKYVMVDLPAGPDVGRCFAHSKRVPVGTPIINKEPFENLTNVVEVQATHVRAVFDPANGRLVTIYPIGFR